MPEGRLAKARDAYKCSMCGDDMLVGNHTREAKDARGNYAERCPRRLFAVSMPPSLNEPGYGAGV